MSDVDASERDYAGDVHVLCVDGREIIIVGTAHISRESADLVREVIDKEDPDCVCVELDPQRFEALSQKTRWENLDLRQIIRNRQLAPLLANLILASYQRKLGGQLGVLPGAELLAATRVADERGIPVALCDRDIRITLRRAWASTSLWKKAQLLSLLGVSLFERPKLDEEELRRIRDKDVLSELISEMGEAMPSIKKALIDERDVYLSQKIKAAGGRKIVAILGAGHVPGILTEIEKDTPLAPLEQLPRRPFWPQLLKWGIPAAIIALLAYGFFTGDAERSWESIWIWVLVNGSLSALGALLALGHPVTILTAFLAAPLTSLNPMIAAGWVSGLAQAVVKKPTVEDLENLPDAISTVKGFWLNPVSRILLVVVLSNLGSTLGTFIGGSWIAGRSLS